MAVYMAGVGLVTVSLRRSMLMLGFLHGSCLGGLGWVGMPVKCVELVVWKTGHWIDEGTLKVSSRIRVQNETREKIPFWSNFAPL